MFNLGIARPCQIIVKFIYKHNYLHCWHLHNHDLNEMALFVSSYTDCLSDRHGVCPKPHTTPTTTAPEPTTHWPTPRPETSPHKLNVRLLLIVAVGCCVFVSLVVVVLFILRKRHTHPGDSNFISTFRSLSAK